MPATLNLFWFRRDLRLHDNAGLYQALRSGRPVMPLFIFDRQILDKLEDRDDRRVSYIYSALRQLDAELGKHGSALHVFYGEPLDIIKDLIQTREVTALYTNTDYEPYARERDDAVEYYLKEKKVGFHSAKDIVIFEKKEVAKDDGMPYSIFTPYYRKWRSTLTPEHYRSYDCASYYDRFLKTPAAPWPSLESMNFQQAEINPGPALPADSIIANYHRDRDIPSIEGTSRMSVHLRFGTVSIRQLVQRAISLNEIYLKELAWREFFMQTLWHRPQLVNACCKPAYEAIQWRNNEAEFSKWCEGMTGFPIVDAGMRELAATGLMHNRVRMIVASFLVKDLLIDWRWGEAWFARMLLDYELASNNGNWQWVAGCGCDAAPYFRVFNPETQAVKFDKQKRYIKKWVPEYGTANYPPPMADHKMAAARCIAAYAKALAGER